MDLIKPPMGLFKCFSQRRACRSAIFLKGLVRGFFRVSGERCMAASNSGNSLRDNPTKEVASAALISGCRSFWASWAVQWARVAVIHLSLSVQVQFLPRPPVTAPIAKRIKAPGFEPGDFGVRILVGAPIPIPVPYRSAFRLSRSRIHAPDMEEHQHTSSHAYPSARSGRKPKSQGQPGSGVTVFQPIPQIGPQEGHEPLFHHLHKEIDVGFEGTG